MSTTTSLNDRLLWKDAPGYEEARLDAMWNGRKTERRPAAIIHPESHDDVIAAVKFAVENELRIGIRAGGHSWVATGIRENALLIDLSKLNSVAVDAAHLTAEVGPGARGHELYGALREKDLAFPTGHCTTPGVGGFLIGAGYGWNSRALGPGCLNVEGVDVVLADGTSIIHATDETHPEIMWAVRGSGPGFFAVVTKFYLRVYPAYTQILRSYYLFPESMIEEVFTWVYELLPQTSPSLEIAVKVSYVDGIEEPTCSVAAIGFCTEETGNDIHAVLEGAPILERTIRMSERVPTTLDEIYEVSNRFMPKGKRYAVDGVWTSASAAEVNVAARNIVRSLPTRDSFVFYMFWGNYPTQDNACWSRQSPLYFSPNALWTDPADDLRCELWAHHQLQDFAEIEEGTQFADANPGDRPAVGIDDEPGARLEELRAKYDPQGRFVTYLDPEESTTALGEYLRSHK